MNEGLAAGRCDRKSIRIRTGQDQCGTMRSFFRIGGNLNRCIQRSPTSSALYPAQAPYYSRGILVEPQRSGSLDARHPAGQGYSPTLCITCEAKDRVGGRMDEFTGSTVYRARRRFVVAYKIAPSNSPSQALFENLGRGRLRVNGKST